MKVAVAVVSGLRGCVCQDTVVVVEQIAYELALALVELVLQLEQELVLG